MYDITTDVLRKTKTHTLPIQIERASASSLSSTDETEESASNNHITVFSHSSGKSSAWLCPVKYVA